MTPDPSQERCKWDERYRGSSGPGDPATVLLENAHLLPGHGQALDVACGLGANAMFLAQRGFEVHAWDVSPVAIARLSEESRKGGLPVIVQVRDVLAEPPTANSFDVVVVSRFLDRGLTGSLTNSLRTGGLLFYETFTCERVNDAGPTNLRYRLAPNELLALFAALRVIVYREEGRLGDVQRGFRNQAMLIAQRR